MTSSPPPPLIRSDTLTAEEIEALREESSRRGYQEPPIPPPPVLPSVRRLSNDQHESSLSQTSSPSQPALKPSDNEDVIENTLSDQEEDPNDNDNTGNIDNDNNNNNNNNDDDEKSIHETQSCTSSKPSTSRHDGSITPDGSNSNSNSNASQQHPASAVHPRLARQSSHQLSIEDIPDERKAKILRKHLPSADTSRSTSAMGQPQQQVQQPPATTNDPNNDNENGNNNNNNGNGNGSTSGNNTYSSIDESALATGTGPDGNESDDPQNDDFDEFPNSSTYHHLQAGDVVHDLYKWEANARNSSRRRTSSFGTLPGDIRQGSFSSTTRPALGFTPSATLSTTNTLYDEEQGQALPVPPNDPTLDIRSIRAPGGFRRNFLNRRAAEEGRPPGPYTSTFIDFLSLYGSFAGEDLEEEDEDETETEEEEGDEEGGTRRGVSSGGAGGGGRRGGGDERTPLLSSKPKRHRLSRRRSGVSGEFGDATPTQACMMLLKSFIGTGILFLGRAFFNGGLLFSTIVLCAVACVSLYSFLLLVYTRFVVPGSFGDIGGQLWGRWMRIIILVSITLSQLGFVSAYTIFIAENMQAFVLAVTDCKQYYSTSFFIVLQLFISLPFAMIRNIQKLSGTALIADAFILVGILYIFGQEIKVIAEEGMADVKMFNPDSFPLMIGTAVFSFEGIGLVIPITESMREPRKFPVILSGVMTVVMSLLAISGILAYSAYGSNTQAVVLVNLPQQDRFVNVAQFLYSIAILLSTPLQLFPAIRIMENGIFSRSGKFSNRVKWQKNLFRAAVVAGCTVLAWVGAEDLDKFVALVGSTACVPLAFCYPPLLHYKACANTRAKKAADLFLFSLGLCLALFTTTQTITMIAKGGGSGGGGSDYTRCPTPDSV